VLGDTFSPTEYIIMMMFQKYITMNFLSNSSNNIKSFFFAGEKLSLWWIACLNFFDVVGGT